MRIAALILISSIANLALAQDPVFIFEDTVNDNNRIKLTSFNSYSSNRLNNEYLDKFIFGGNIDTELKDKMSGKLRGMNVVGLEAEQRIDAYAPDVNLLGKEIFGMKLSFSDNHYGSAQFTPDLFNVAMNGNGNYVGDSLDLTFSHLQYQHYQKFGIGFYHQHNMSSIQISYVAGSKGLEAGLSNSWMYTRQNVDTIDLSILGNGYSTERFYPYWAFQGGGFAIDVDYNFIFEGKLKNRQVVNLRINNLGVIFWNKKTNNYIMNLNDSYSGFNVVDLINQDTSADNSIDWLDTLQVDQTIARNIETLPVEIIVQKVADRGIDAKLQAIFGFKAILVPDYFPYLYAGAYYQPNKSLSLSSRVSYGGFAGFRWGLNVNYWLKEKLYFSLGSFDLIGLASKKHGYGRGLNFSFYYNL